MRSGFYQDKNVLVAGSAGFVGSHLVRRLVKLGANVKGTLFKKRPQDRISECEYQKCDLTEASACKAMTYGMDYVFMAAANSSGAGVMEKTPLVHLTPNVIMNARILEACYENRVKKLCFISSNTVYPVTDIAVKETDIDYSFFEKYYIVGWMKLFSEIMCEMYSKKIKNPMSVLVVRPGNLYGPYDKYTWNESKVIAALIRRVVEKQNPIKIWGDGKDVKDFLYIDDFIHGCLSIFAKSHDFSVVNLASGKPVTIRKVLRTILRECKYTNAKLRYDASMPTMIPKRKINILKAKKEFGWSPRIGLTEGIKKTVGWYKEYFKTFTPEGKQ